MAKRATRKKIKIVDGPQYWGTDLPSPIKLTHDRELTTLFEAGRFLADNFKEGREGEGLSGTIRALMSAATTGRPDDIDYAVLMLRLLLDAERLTRGGADDPDREKKAAPFKWQSWKGKPR